jgi:hypothetical protein
MKITGGLSIYSPIVGIWRSDESGEVYRDRMIPVRIIATEGQMEDILRVTLRYYPEEEAILYYRITNSVQMRYRSEMDP